VTESLKESAERLRLGITHGWLSQVDAVAWADEVIAKSEKPPWPVLEVALAGMKDTSAVAQLLTKVEGVADPVLVMRRCLGDLATWVGSDSGRAEQAAAFISSAASQGLLPQEEFGDEGILLSEYFHEAIVEGYLTLDQAVASLREFLDTYAIVA
jgi:hypothetical protein